MRILVITNQYPTAAHPARGVFVEQQIEGLRAIGVQVRVLCIDRRRDGPWSYYRMGPQVRQALAEFDPEAIHVMYGGVMADQVVRRHHARPVVVTFHGSDLLGENLSGPVRKLISWYGVWCSRRAARGAEKIIVVARHLLPALRGCAGLDKTAVIPCGIDLERFQPMEPALCRRQLGWAAGVFHVLFASSNADPVKRPDLAAAAVAELQRRGAPAELHWLTGQPNSLVPVWLNASDVLLLTSRHEGSPTIVKEALACGVPIVSVDVGDVAEHLAGIEGCWLAEAKPADLAEKLGRVRQRRRRLDCQAQVVALSHVKIAQRLQQYYNEMLTPAGREIIAH